MSYDRTGRHTAGPGVYECEPLVQSSLPFTRFVVEESIRLRNVDAAAPALLQFREDTASPAAGRLRGAPSPTHGHDAWASIFSDADFSAAVLPDVLHGRDFAARGVADFLLASRRSLPRGDGNGPLSGGSIDAEQPSIDGRAVVASELDGEPPSASVSPGSASSPASPVSPSHAGSNDDDDDDTSYAVKRQPWEGGGGLRALRRLVIASTPPREPTLSHPSNVTLFLSLSLPCLTEKQGRRAVAAGAEARRGGGVWGPSRSAGGHSIGGAVGAAGRAPRRWHCTPDCVRAAAPDPGIALPPRDAGLTGSLSRRRQGVRPGPAGIACGWKRPGCSAWGWRRGDGWGGGRRAHRRGHAALPSVGHRYGWTLFEICVVVAFFIGFNVFVCVCVCVYVCV